MGRKTSCDKISCDESLIIKSRNMQHGLKFPRRFVSLFQKIHKEGMSVNRTQTRGLGAKKRNLLVNINNNRQTILSVRWEKNQTLVSLHHMFLSAPRDIMDALACYIKREHKAVAPEIKAYIESNRTLLDHSQTIDKRKLETKGAVYDLAQIYRRLNKQEFQNSLDLAICWFGSKEPKARSKLSLGLYYDTLKLVKVHRLLDSSKVPPYVIEFIVFHEMLHAACPAYIDEKGVLRMHGHEFKAREESFYCYNEASQWIKKHEKDFFLRQGRAHGRT